MCVCVIQLRATIASSSGKTYTSKAKSFITKRRDIYASTHNVIEFGKLFTFATREGENTHATVLLPLLREINSLS